MEETRLMEDNNRWETLHCVGSLYFLLKKKFEPYVYVTTLTFLKFNIKRDIFPLTYVDKPTLA